jgi:hypothetical protein
VTWFNSFARRAGLHLPNLLDAQVFDSTAFVFSIFLVCWPSFLRTPHHEGFISKAFIFPYLLMSTRRETSPFGDVGPMVCSPSSSWLVLIMESSAMLGVVYVVVVVEVDAQTEVVGEPLVLK